jgi:hypothetical protein
VSDKFNPVLVTEAGRETIKCIREVFMAALEQLERILPVNREGSLTRTKLEEACFWAVRSAAIEHEDKI